MLLTARCRRQRVTPPMAVVCDCAQFGAHWRTPVIALRLALAALRLRGLHDAASSSARGMAVSLCAGSAQCGPSCSNHRDGAGVEDACASPALSDTRSSARQTITAL